MTSQPVETVTPSRRVMCEGVNKMMNRFRFRVMSVMVFAFAALTMALPALATPSAGETAVNTAVSDAAAEASSIVTTGIPVILGVAVLWVALKFGKRLLAKI